MIFWISYFAYRRGEDVEGRNHPIWSGRPKDGCRRLWMEIWWWKNVPRDFWSRAWNSRWAIWETIYWIPGSIDRKRCWSGIYQSKRNRQVYPLRILLTCLENRRKVVHALFLGISQSINPAQSNSKVFNGPVVRFTISFYPSLTWWTMPTLTTASRLYRWLASRPSQ